MSEVSKPQRIQRLEHTRTSLKIEIRRLESRRYLTSDEQSARQQLKKKNLVAKDALTALHRTP